MGRKKSAVKKRKRVTVKLLQRKHAGKIVRTAESLEV